MWTGTRRDLLRIGAAAAAGARFGTLGSHARQPKPDRTDSSDGVEVLNPQDRVPLSFFIDDST